MSIRGCHLDCRCDKYEDGDFSVVNMDQTKDRLQLFKVGLFTKNLGEHLKVVSKAYSFANGTCQDPEFASWKCGRC